MLITIHLILWIGFLRLIINFTDPMEKQVRGFFVILIKQFDDTMFGAQYHYTPWCIAHTKFCRFHKVDRIKKFDLYKDAQTYIKEIRPNSSHDRDYEVAYLTYNSSDNQLLNTWVQIRNEADAVEYDQHLSNKVHQTSLNNANIPSWDSTNFQSLFKQITS